GQRLLRDPQDLEKVGNSEAGVAVHEMQHAMMGPAEPVLGEHGVGIACEVPVGEEQKLDMCDEVEPFRALVGPVLRTIALRAVAPGCSGGSSYVSHVDIFEGH